MPKRILFYPDAPRKCNKVWHALKTLGVATTTNAADQYDVAFYWCYRSVSSHLETIMQQIPVSVPLYNAGGADVRKKRVDQVHREVFGYGLAVDPAGEGIAWEKPDAQCAGHGRIVRLPVAPRDGMVYHRVIDSRIDVATIEEIRVPVFKREIPYLWLKRRRTGELGTKQNREVVLVRRLMDALGADEQVALLQFCSAFGVELVELDVMRHSDGRLFVVDVNNMAGTLMGPTRPSPSWANDQAWMTAAWHDAFARNFLQ